ENSNDEYNYPREWKPKEGVSAGVKIMPYLYYNSIDVPSFASAIPKTADSIPANVKTYWYCQCCKKTYAFNKSQAIQHANDCIDNDKESENSHRIQ
ncbi:uncharacterized protein BX663DRAFT_433239, partial [Cokeromyces recurvatus]|uniref:uncharacterized protein n=1 Tax=Cokeromyces recurvatus TaxID=90255 RepID=UPI00221E72FE